ncbi:MAG: iron-containing alcohol dehydrogenase [Desulfobulbaceae bacterium]|nr:iron-containing alcohol dehydrogenase [Desulfobulbaceae bacterium]HIJ78845.1 iron-containing alcohol dehydrogenase [Deltaproteobacteria bacterium]
MYNFVFENPTKIIFGRDSAPRIGAETAGFGKKALLVYGRRSIRQNNLYQIVLDSLADAGLEIHLHGGVQPNPGLTQVRAGIETVRNHNIEVVVAVGGGSVIDSAKAIAAGALVNHDVWQFFKGKKGIKNALPITCIPTIAGSGSEANSGMVLTNETTRQKIGIGNKLLLPKVAILDPALTFSVPPAYTAYGAADTIAHLLEFYFNREESFAPLQDHYSEGLILTTMESCMAAITEPGNYQARAALLWAGTLALNGISASGLGRVGFPLHMIEHAINGIFATAHGAGLAALLPGWLKWCVINNPGRVARLGQGLFKIKEGDETAIARQTALQLTAWLHEIGAPTRLADLTIGPEQIPAIAENSAMQAKLWKLREYPPKVIEDLLFQCI